MTTEMKAAGDYFTAERPFDSQKDECLLDAMEQTLAMCVGGEMALMFTVGVVKRDAGWRVEVFSPGEHAHGEGRTVREALANLFNESEVGADS